MRQSSLGIEIRKYMRAMKFYECVDYIYLDQINKVDFKRINKRKNAKLIFDNVYKDFRLVNKLLEEGDLLNGTTILRKLYENIIYIIATSYDKELEVDLNNYPSQFRKIVEDECEELFTNDIQKEDFNKIYKYLSKIVHTTSLNEYITYLVSLDKHKMYLINNMKYVMIVIEYIYINFLFKKTKENNDFNSKIFNVATFLNLANVVYYMKVANKKEKFIKSNFSYDLNDKYLQGIEYDFNTLIELYEKNKKDFGEIVNEIIQIADEAISKSKYKEKVEEMLKNKNE